MMLYTYDLFLFKFSVNPVTLTCLVVFAFCMQDLYTAIITMYFAYIIYTLYSYNYCNMLICSVHLCN